ncbi:MAG TPA: DoxX family protein [Candidatus Angelobacter sp.]|nr:DoxX family protein [Candidatus Angelobacter sp.]
MKKGPEASSAAMAVARVAVGVMFIMFAQYKLLNRDFAHGGYEKYVGGWVQESAVSFYKPFLRATLHYPTASGYAVGVAEMLIGLSMVLGLFVRPVAIVGALFMLNIALSTWNLPPGTAAWRYLGNQLENIPLMFLFIIFYVHGAGGTWGLDRNLK